MPESQKEVKNINDNTELVKKDVSPSLNFDNFQAGGRSSDLNNLYSSQVQKKPSQSTN